MHFLGECNLYDFLKILFLPLISSVSSVIMKTKRGFANEKDDLYVPSVGDLPCVGLLRQQAHLRKQGRESGAERISPAGGRLKNLLLLVQQSGIQG
jgi:hypothetical protein